MLKMKKQDDTLRGKLEEFYKDREYNGCCAYTIRGYRQKLRVVFSQTDLDTAMHSGDHRYAGWRTAIPRFSRNSHRPFAGNDNERCAGV